MYLYAFGAGLTAFLIYRTVLGGFYTVKPDERAVITSFGRALRLSRDPPAADERLAPEEREPYRSPKLRVIYPGGPYLAWPWQKVHKVSVSTQGIDLTWDPTKRQTTVEAVTKDNLTTGVGGQIRFRVSENHLYPYFFGVSTPLEHVMGYFIAVLRERIANFAEPRGQRLIRDDEEAGEDGVTADLSDGISINDLRKNLPLLNEYMEQQCRSTGARYGIELDAALITRMAPRWGLVSGTRCR